MPTAPQRFDLVRRTSVRDYRIFRGSTWTLRLEFDSTWGASWSGFAARAQLRPGTRARYPDTKVCDITARIVSRGPARRVIDLSIPASVTETIGVFKGTWDCEIFNGTVVYRVASGTWCASDETTA